MHHQRRILDHVHGAFLILRAEPTGPCFEIEDASGRTIAHTVDADEADTLFTREMHARGATAVYSTAARHVTGTL